MKEVKIKTDLVNGRVVELKPNIFVFEIPDLYELTMLFCRHQEFYESPYKDIKGQNFSLEYYMNKYRKERNEKVFTYPQDWIGFNIPSNSFKRGLNVFYENDNANEYDEIMTTALFDDTIARALCDMNAVEKFYLIGVRSIEQLSTLNHELAHALYYTDKKYKAECKKIFDLIDKTVINKAFDILIEMGYAQTKTILYDELQAYLSTGLHKKLHFLEGEEVVLGSGDSVLLTDLFKQNFERINK